MPYPNSPLHDILQIVADVVHTVVSPSDPKYHTDEYWTNIDKLKSRLQAAAVSSGHPTEVENTTPNITRLYQLSAQIYLEYASSERRSQSERVRRWLDEAFDRLGRLSTWPCPLPLFILGCEAESDERRLTIMEVVDRTEKDCRVRHLGCLRNLLRVSWTQDDLAPGNINYIDRLNRMMSLSDMAPMLV
jgi:hypothetical protein